ncbi:unnamed protein product [Cladocopium goreaui]|uniref:DNA (Cytosine-5-)-methyltransferase n=1 Tax=Cladocopium goreaui TaxID=2562237 RepID=A0A9P1DGQ8_9DINO|nr:unnamed protein product [Cladocopium goreaui]
MASRDYEGLDPRLYSCGFPCQPYSRLRRNSRLMDEPDAKPFWATLEAILRTGPLIALLENVYGVLAVKEKAKSWCIQFLLN